jgi:hypothetical protein
VRRVEDAGAEADEEVEAVLVAIGGGDVVLAVAVEVGDLGLAPLVEVGVEVGRQHGGAATEVHPVGRDVVGDGVAVEPADRERPARVGQEAGWLARLGVAQAAVGDAAEHEVGGGVIGRAGGVGEVAVALVEGDRDVVARLLGGLDRFGGHDRDHEVEVAVAVEVGEARARADGRVQADGHERHDLRVEVDQRGVEVDRGGAREGERELLGGVADEVAARHAADELAGEVAVGQRHARRLAAGPAAGEVGHHAAAEEDEVAVDAVGGAGAHGQDLHAVGGGGDADLRVGERVEGALLAAAQDEQAVPGGHGEVGMLVGVEVGDGELARREAGRGGERRDEAGVARAEADLELGPEHGEDVGERVAVEVAEREGVGGHAQRRVGREVVGAQAEAADAVRAAAPADRADLRGRAHVVARARRVGGRRAQGVRPEVLVDEGVAVLGAFEDAVAADVVGDGRQVGARGGEDGGRGGEEVMAVETAHGGVRSGTAAC